MLPVAGAHERNGGEVARRDEAREQARSPCNGASRLRLAGRAWVQWWGEGPGYPLHLAARRLCVQPRSREPEQAAVLAGQRRADGPTGPTRTRRAPFQGPALSPDTQRHVTSRERERESVVQGFTFLRLDPTLTVNRVKPGVHRRVNCLRTNARQRGFASAEIHGKQKWTIDFARYVVCCMRPRKFIRAFFSLFFFFGLTMEGTWDFFLFLLYFLFEKIYSESCSKCTGLVDTRSSFRLIETR